MNTRSLSRSAVLPVVFSILLLSQGCVNVHLRTANDYYAQFAYAPAANEYEYVLNRIQDRDALVRVADCYRQMGNVPKTEYWYRKALRLDEQDLNWHLYLAEALMKTGNYQEAREHLTSYLDVNKNDMRAKQMMLSCDSLPSFFRDTTLYSVDLLPFNTPSYNYFAPSFYRSGIVCLSDRNEKGFSRKMSDVTGSRYLDLFSVMKGERGSWLAPEFLPGDVNGRYNEGPVAFTNDYNTMFLTRNNYVSNTVEKNSRNVNVLKIYRAENESGEWKIMGKLSINNDDYSIGHPALNQTATVMVFTSDMPWGYGGTDLYMSRWEGGDNWSTPVNLGPDVNTTGNESFPSLYNDSILYYSTDGLMGLGGLDVFSARLRGDAAVEPENLGYPVNSSGDDFGFIMDSTGLSGFLCSNRNSNNDKIYRFEKNPPKLVIEVQINDASGGKPVPGVAIRLSGGRRDTTLYTDDRGRLLVSAQPDRLYRFKCTHPEFFTISDEISTSGFKYSETIKVPVEIRKITFNKSVVWQGIFFNKKESKLKPSSIESLQRLVDLLTENPYLKVEIGVYTDSRNSDEENIALTRERGEVLTNYFTTRGIDPTRFLTIGYGETKLLNRCVNGILCIEEDHEVNNRVEIVITGVNR